MRLDLTTLNLVLAIAATRNITRGAEREHLAPVRHIRSLNTSAMAEWQPVDPLDRTTSSPDSSPLPSPDGVARQSRFSPKARP